MFHDERFVMSPSTRRAGFTLVEMLVAMALTIFIMVILAQAFVTGLETFRQLKGLGDMQEGLRTALTRLQADLRADHFEAGRRLSDTNFWLDGQPRMGFVRIVQNRPSTFEGNDTDGLPSWRAFGIGVGAAFVPDDVIHLSIRLRGNHREGFLLANVPAGSPLLTGSTTIPGLSPLPDARFQDMANTYTSAWGEVAYFLAPQGSTIEPQNPNSTAGTPLYTLWRVQKVVPADATAANAAAVPVGLASSYVEVSCQPGVAANLVFNSPVDLASGQRSITAYSPGSGAAPLLNNVVSFNVQIMRRGLDNSFVDVPANSQGLNVFDTAATDNPYQIFAVQITLRVWDPATQQARQVSIVQEM
jgi:prepilin-type N-terminal cleavage/methylation domain-containing protein